MDRVPMTNRGYEMLLEELKQLKNVERPAIIAAIATGFVAPEIAVKFKVGGEVFLSLLMMMVVPLVVMSVMSGILGLGDVRKLGKPGACAVAYYMCTTVLAVITGLIVVNILKPGVDKEVAAAPGQGGINHRHGEGRGRGAVGCDQGQETKESKRQGFLRRKGSASG